MLTPAGAETYRRWAAGWCPCCGSAIIDWIDRTPPAVIGEGVEICGRCVAMDHMGAAGGLRDAMLEAIASRDDAPIERLLP